MLPSGHSEMKAYPFETEAITYLILLFQICRCLYEKNLLFETKRSIQKEKKMYLVNFNLDCLGIDFNGTYVLFGFVLYFSKDTFQCSFTNS